jgi:hypothetical protein
MKTNRTYSGGTGVKPMEFSEITCLSNNFGLVVLTSWWVGLAWFPQGCAAFSCLVSAGLCRIFMIDED